MRRWLIRLTVLWTCGAFTVIPLASAAPSHVLTTIPFEETIPATPCTGEAVAVSGSFLLLSSVLIDSGGGTHSVSVLVPQDISGVGLATGTVYHYAGVDHSTFSLSGPPQNEITDTFNLVLVSGGSGGNLLVTSTFHETVDAIGEVTALVDQTSAMCTG